MDWFQRVCSAPLRITGSLLRRHAGKIRTQNCFTLTLSYLDSWKIPDCFPSTKKLIQHFPVVQDQSSRQKDYQVWCLVGVLSVEGNLDAFYLVAQFDGGTKLQIHTLLNSWQRQQQKGLSVNILHKTTLIRKESWHFHWTKTFPIWWVWDASGSLMCIYVPAPERCWPAMHSLWSWWTGPPHLHSTPRGFCLEPVDHHLPPSKIRQQSI